jgi:2-polyprenyl-3-methyl-5-hydroxy-6-metoxy-1,4-benzoquinol methylase
MLKTINIPFFFEAQNDSRNGEFPLIFPFSYYYDPKLKLFRQQNSDDLKTLLEKVYKKGSMLNGAMNLIGGGLQGQESLKFILNFFPNLKDKKVLEIGCGNGFLLKELSNYGGSCVGLEPGKQIELASQPNIELINDFFPSIKVKGEFDLIIHFNVLEHLENPVEILKEQVKLLGPEGKIIFGVPNCEPYLNSGDLSLFVHEHFNYFTQESLHQIALASNLKIESLSIGAKNGMIFCALTKQNLSNELNVPFQNFDLHNYESKVQNSLMKLDSFLSKYKEKDVAIYCPIRSMNSLSILNKTNCRLVDDNSELNGKYLPNFSNPIENLSALTLNPPQNILIFSRTFWKDIMNKCKNHSELRNTEIFNIEEFDN